MRETRLETVHTVGSVTALLEAWFPPALAEDWDAIGLIAGRRDAEVSKVALAVDPTLEVVQWAIDNGAQLLVVHHPLFLRGTTSVDGDTPKGDIVHTAITDGLAIFVAHTNADSARPGVSDALIEAFGVKESAPIRPHYSNPSLGLGRVGMLDAPTTLAEFAARVAWALPATHAGIRWAGAADRTVQRVAVCGGAGDDLLPEVDADVYVTSDLRHHVAAEYLAAGRAALVDIPHAAAESLWLHPVAERLQKSGVESTVCPLVTDPWAGHHA